MKSFLSSLFAEHALRGRAACLLFVGTMFVAASPHLRAVTIENSVIIDLATLEITPDSRGGELILGIGSSLVLVPTFTPEVGDVLRTTITFANSDMLRITGGPNIVDNTGPDYFSSFTFYFGDPSGEVLPDTLHETFSTTVDYLGLSGSALPGSSSVGVLAQSIMGNLALGEFVQFRGLTITSTVLNVSSEETNFGTFGVWGGRAGDFEIISGTGSQVPDAGGTMILIAPALALIAFLRRRDSTASPAPAVSSS